MARRAARAEASALVRARDLLDRLAALTPEQLDLEVEVELDDGRGNDVRFGRAANVGVAASADPGGGTRSFLLIDAVYN